jgi:hypothetical protein
MTRSTRPRLLRRTLVACAISAASLTAVACGSESMGGGMEQEEDGGGGEEDEGEEEDD